MKRYDDEDDDGSLDDNGVLKDGRSFRVPLTMRDGLSDLQLSVRDAVGRQYWDDARPLVVDAFGGIAGLHRPGPVFIADEAERSRARDLKEQAYRDANEAAENAWRGPDRSEAGVEGDIRRVTSNAYPSAYGAPGRQLTEDELATLRDEREKAYREAELADQNAWRYPRP